MPPNPLRHPLFIVGATAVGKSATALEMARHLDAHATPAAILSMDAMMVYRGADIGTGKPTAAEREEIPHGGLDLVEIGQRFDVADFLSHAREFFHDQQSSGRRVIICGGTGLYFRALTQGLCEAPEAPHSLREELNRLSIGELQSRLKRVDPEMVRRLDLQNPRRLARAIAVIEWTGKSLAHWQAETPPPLVPEFSAVWLQRSLPDLHRAISTRIATMFAAGWGHEVAQLIVRHGHETVSRFVAIGYRNLAEALQTGEKPEILGQNPRLQEKIALETRQYAKRQLTWFSRETRLIPMQISASFSSAAVVELLNL